MGRADSVAMPLHRNNNNGFNRKYAIRGNKKIIKISEDPRILTQPPESYPRSEMTTAGDTNQCNTLDIPNNFAAEDAVNKERTPAQEIKNHSASKDSVSYADTINN